MMANGGTPPRTAYRTHLLRIDLLKNLVGLEEISFEDKPITGIFGPNCCGKSTILHALACCYQPLAGTDEPNYQFPQFFVPNSDSLWDGSDLTLTHSYEFYDLQAKEQVKVDSQETTYRKKSTMWKPRYEKRPTRHVSFVGVNSCVPCIETERSTTRINYTATPRNDAVAAQVREKLSAVFNRPYDELNDILSTTNRKYRGVRQGALRYSALSMGAGEQRMLYLLEEVFRSPKYGLILVDEIDLLLHGDALRKFLEIASHRAADKKLQIVFTSHRECLLEYDDLINVRHIHNENGKTRCLSETKPDALYRLTGHRERPLEILVEDDLASAIVDKIVASLGMRKYVDTVRFGAARNAFTVMAGMILKGDDVDNSLFVLDGDEYRSKEAKEAQIKAVLTGDHAADVARREKGLSVTTDLALPEGERPEHFIHSLLTGLEDAQLPNEEAREVANTAKAIVVTVDKHDYISQLVRDLGYGDDRRVGLAKIIDVAALSPQWVDYVKPVHDWLEARKHMVIDGVAAPAPPAPEVVA